MKINYGCHKNGCFNIILEVWVENIALLQEKSLFLHSTQFFYTFSSKCLIFTKVKWKQKSSTKNIYCHIRLNFAKSNFFF